MPVNKLYLNLIFFDLILNKRDLDFINLMSYVRKNNYDFFFSILNWQDLHGSWEEILGHHTALHPRRDEDQDQSKLNVEWTVNNWIKQGCPKQKLLLGIALYGRTFRYFENSTLGAPNLGPGGLGQVNL